MVRPEAKALEAYLEDLLAYQYLHVTQIAEAMRGDDSRSLAQVIQETGHPEQLLRCALPSPPRQEAPVPTAQLAPPLAPSRPKASPGRKSKGVLGKLIVLAALLAASAWGYRAWEKGDLQTPSLLGPAVTIDTLENGQPVPAGREFQVAVTARTWIFSNLDSMELRFAHLALPASFKNDPQTGRLARPHRRQLRVAQRDRSASQHAGQLRRQGLALVALQQQVQPRQLPPSRNERAARKAACCPGWGLLARWGPERRPQVATEANSACSAGLRLDSFRG